VLREKRNRFKETERIENNTNYFDRSRPRSRPNYKGPYIMRFRNPRDGFSTDTWVEEEHTKTEMKILEWRKAEVTDIEVQAEDNSTTEEDSIEINLVEEPLGTELMKEKKKKFIIRG